MELADVELHLDPLLLAKRLGVQLRGQPLPVVRPLRGELHFGVADHLGADQAVQDLASLLGLGRGSGPHRGGPALLPVVAAAVPPVVEQSTRHAEAPGDLLQLLAFRDPLKDHLVAPGVPNVLLQLFESGPARHISLSEFFYYWTVVI